eukprot:EC095024.1.p3 GENE.EC095024.1~~EC095024.1.p3  ORF type:complete len:107 (-),score=7.17 EC095024.1:24-344(-)
MYALSYICLYVLYLVYIYICTRGTKSSWNKLVQQAKPGMCVTINPQEKLEKLSTEFEKSISCVQAQQSLSFTKNNSTCQEWVQNFQLIGSLPAQIFETNSSRSPKN